MKEVLQETAAALVDESIQITIKVPAVTTREKLLKRLKLFKEEKVFKLKPLSIGSLIRISKLVIPIDTDTFIDKKSLLDIGYNSYDKYGKSLVKIAAIALSNTKEEPTEEFISIIEYNVTGEELQRIYNAVIRMMDINSFISSIISIRGVNLLAMNPTTQRSSIASGKPLEE